MINDYLARLERALKRLPADQRDAVLDEAKAHLEAQAAQMQDEGMDADAAEAAAVERFGSPDEIAAGYDEAEGVVRRPTGEVVLEVTKAVGRGAGKAAVGVGRVAGVGLKGLFKVAGAVVITALIVAGVIATAAIVFADDWAPYIQDAIEDNVGRELYTTHIHGDARNDTFYAPPAETLTISWSGWGAYVGCTDMRLFAPDGSMAYDGQLCHDDRGRTTLPPVNGQWRVEVDRQPGLEGQIQVTYRPLDP